MARSRCTYRNYANKKSLAGKRIGVVREFMIEATLADRDSIRIANQALADLEAARRRNRRSGKL